MRNTLIFFLISLLIIGCKDETTTTSTIHDPSKPVQITGFEPMTRQFQEIIAYSFAVKTVGM